MANRFCIDCKAYATVVFDHKAGHTICSECGLVLHQSRSIHETSDWRTFADDSDDKDSTHAGGSLNPLLHGGGLGTVVSKQNSALLVAFNIIAVMGDRLGLVETIKNHAKELYKKLMDDQKVFKGRNLNAIMAACLFYACQEEGFPMTVKEISKVANGVTIKKINIAKRLLRERLEIVTRIIDAGDLARRYCSNLGMSQRAIKAVNEIVEKIENLDIRRSSTSIVAAVIYMITQVSDETLSLREILNVTEVTEGTIKGTYKDLYPYASRLIPNWYAHVEDLKKLCVP